MCKSKGASGIYQIFKYVRKLEAAKIFAALLLTVACLCAAGCSYVNHEALKSDFRLPASDFFMRKNGNTPDYAKITKSGVYFDTVISVTLYGNDKEKYIDKCFELADKYDAMFSISNESSDIARVNSSGGEPLRVSDETIEILKLSRKYSEMSDGKFSLVCGALTSLWNIGGEKVSDDKIININQENIKLENQIQDKNPEDNNLENPIQNKKTSDNKSENQIQDKNPANNRVPDKIDIEAAMSLCGDDLIEINEETNEVRVLKPGVKLDFGACAKGYIADRMKEYLVNEGVESGIISLGGNILLIGGKPSGNLNSFNKRTSPNNEAGKFLSEPYTIGIAKPFSKNGEMITTLNLTDTSVVTSGNYQRCFEQDGVLYHHIIDLTTGYPADTGLNSVSIICPSSFEADIMSTICYLLGKEKGTRLTESLDLKSIFISSDNKIIYNSFQ